MLSFDRPLFVIETPQRIEPARLQDVPEAISDLVAELSAITAKLESSLHPATASSLAKMVRIMNTYYSNLSQQDQPGRIYSCVFCAMS